MLSYIDLFAGCGGLSLGLQKAGFQGIFAIEKTVDAFKTLKYNLIDNETVLPFKWPSWLPCKEMTTKALLENYGLQLKQLQGKVDLIAGGPPCQGFSFAGKRDSNDPRNKLTDEYIEIVSIVQPKYLLLENVKGFSTAFKKQNTKEPYAMIVKKKLESLGYQVFHQMVNASDFGVPQPRARFILIAFRKDIKIAQSPFDLLPDFLTQYKDNKGLGGKEVTVKQAISDLETQHGVNVMDSVDSKGFKQIKYERKKLSNYQKIMRENCSPDYSPNSLRLARHNQATITRFNQILNYYPKGKSLTSKQLAELGTKKQCFTPLHPNMPSRTITTLPDDLLHYSEPRILTVRENARIQSFPDWFEFQGKYTTGGARRKEECPRYTQVGNAVPPLMAEALGKLIKEVG
ncbi:DNA cytosine methyltransferase [Cysteiniphilum sp. QT6929]|uniref:DNA cytosine methyltransferase n=1 Tax=Cysteiniphilum sp. QT6929 TaxID=2975055 RepID=UPI0024B36DB5|nr:DNA cytosine methyltransferase [Cysteiniphilum sp. QT6929]WHN64519.1 DNA cytosine methyltransferase [Cysteiniphilum sp. QT6929]